MSRALQPHLPSDADFEGLVLRVCREPRFAGEDGRAIFNRRDVLPAARETGGFSETQLAMPCLFKGHERSTMVGYKISWAFTRLHEQGLIRKPFGARRGDGQWQLSNKGRR
jgi:hypothetical protein